MEITGKPWVINHVTGEIIGVSIIDGKTGRPTHVKKVSKNAPLGLFWLDKKPVDIIPYKKLMEWARKRVVPKERSNIDEILESIGLKYYDETDFVFATGAEQITDPYKIIWRDK